MGSASPAVVVAELTLRNWVELGLLFLGLFVLLRFLRRTIAGGIFRGPAMLSWIAILGAFIGLKALNLDVLDALMAKVFPVFILALVVTFQTELRHGIARAGNARIFRWLFRTRTGTAVDTRPVEEIVGACEQFSRRRVGALMAIERNIDLTTWIDTGVPMDAIIRRETLDTIFSTHTVLHDGALVIRGDRVAAAGCLLPLTEKPKLARSYGTRHRAAIGLSEQSDALVVVVSEETGKIHLVERGEMLPVRDTEWMRGYLNTVFAEKQGVAPMRPPE
jgi:diadenylate cyclase